MHNEPNFETACGWWSDLPNIRTPVGWEGHLFRFSVLWDGMLVAQPHRKLMRDALQPRMVLEGA